MSSHLIPPVSDADHTLGPAEAPVTLVEYGDFQCPYCRKAYPIVSSVLKRMSDSVRFAFRHFPLTQLHPHAQHAAEMAEAAGERGQFWAMHDLLFENQSALGDEDLVGYAARLGIDRRWAESALESHRFASRVREQFLSGVRSGVNGTPTFFINGIRHDASWDEPTLFEALQAATLAGRR